MRVAAVAVLVAASLIHPNAPPALARSAPTVAAPAEMLGPLSGPAPTILRPPGVVVESAPLRVPVEIPAAPPVTVPPEPEPVWAGSGACGGDLPPCWVMMRESGGDPTAYNASSGAAGKWQAIASTWAGYGGYASAADAPESVQDDFARELWAGGAGCAHWSAC